MIGISLKSSLWDGMYICIISQDCNGWFFICIICRYGDMFIGDGILVMLPGKAYLLFISARSPPLAGVYGILCCILLVKKCVLLKMSLYFGKIFWIYLVDFVAVSLVFWIIIMAGLVCEF